MLQVESPVEVWVQLRRPSDGAISESRPFQYLPMDTGSIVETPLTRAPHFLNKRFQPDYDLYSHILAADAASLARKMFRPASGAAADVPLWRRCADVQSLPSAVTRDAETNVTVEDLLAFFVSQHPPESMPPMEMVSTSFIDVVESVAPPKVEEVAPPPLPQKGVAADRLRGNANWKSSDEDEEDDVFEQPVFAKVSAKAALAAKTRHSMASSIDERPFSLASSEDLNSRLSAAFSEYSDLTDVHSVYSEADASDVLSLISSTQTLNDRLSLVSEATHATDDAASDVSDSDQTVIDGRSDRISVDTIERQLEILQSMSVDNDFQTYSSFQMAMKHPMLPQWPADSHTDADLLDSAAPTVNNSLDGDAKKDQQSLDRFEEDVIQVDLVYDDPNTEDSLLGLTPAEAEALRAVYAACDSPVAPPRVESAAPAATATGSAVFPPLPPRRFKRINQPLPEPPSQGLKAALLALKQTLKKVGRPGSSKADSTASSSIAGSQESLVRRPESIEKPSKDGEPKKAGQQPETTREADEYEVVSPPPLSAEAPAATGPATTLATPLATPAGQDSNNETLTEAESYALYMRLAPLATASEFDDGENMSMLYAELAPARQVAQTVGQTTNQTVAQPVSQTVDQPIAARSN